MNKMLTVFFDRVNPASRVAKPKCMIKTRKVATIIQTLFVVNTASEILLSVFCCGVSFGLGFSAAGVAAGVVAAGTVAVAVAS